MKGARGEVRAVVTGSLLFYIARITPLSSSIEGDNPVIHL